MERGRLSETAKLLIRDVPAALKDAIRREVDATGVNMNDLLVGILARHFEVAFEPTGRRSAAVGKSRDLLLRVPPTLHSRIHARAVGGVRMQDVAKVVLCEHFAVRFEASPPRRDRRGGRADVKAAA